MVLIKKYSCQNDLFHQRARVKNIEVSPFSIMKDEEPEMANHRPSEDVKGNMLYRWLLMVTLPHERAHAQTHIQGSKIHDGWLLSTYIIH